MTLSGLGGRKPQLAVDNFLSPGGSGPGALSRGMGWTRGRLFSSPPLVSCIPGVCPGRGGGGLGSSACSADPGVRNPPGLTSAAWTSPGPSPGRHTESSALWTPAVSGCRLAWRSAAAGSARPHASTGGPRRPALHRTASSRRARWSSLPVRGRVILQCPLHTCCESEFSFCRAGPAWPSPAPASWGATGERRLPTRALWPGRAHSSQGGRAG